MTQSEADILAEMFATRPAATLAPSSPAARAPSRPWAIVLGLAVVALWVVGMAAWLGSVIGSDAVPASVGMYWVDAAANVVMYGGLMAVAIVAARLAPPPASAAPRAAVAPAALLGFALGAGGMSWAVFEVALNGRLVTPATPAPTGAALLALGTLVTLFQSSAEELFFRGWLQRAAAGLWGPRVAVPLAAAAFAAMHMLAGDRGALTLLNLFLGGLFFGLLALRTGGLAAPVAAHFGWNWAEAILFGLDPNPGVGAYGAVMDHDAAGPTIWAGSAEGMNASVAITFVLAGLLLALWGWPRRADQGR